jgi:hypothetical protein
MGMPAREITTRITAFVACMIGACIWGLCALEAGATQVQLQPAATGLWPVDSFP